MLYKETSKINWLLILQAWTMLWVVIGHAALNAPDSGISCWYSDILTEIAYSFHMPMFVFISGYLFYLTRIQKGTGYFKMLKDKIIRLGIPYLFFTLVGILIKSLFASEMQRPTEISIREFAHAFIYPDDGPVSGFWFLAVLMWCFIFAPIWKVLLHNKLTIICGLISTLALCMWMPWFANNILCFPKFLTHSFYFFLGIVVCHYGLCEIKQSTLFIAGGASLILFIASFILHINGLEVLTAVLGMFVSICLAQILNKFIPSAFSSFRNYTYQIYLMAIFFQIMCKIAFRHLNFENVVAYAICILSGLYFPVLISMAIKKINFAPLCLVIGMKKNKQ